MFKTRLFPAVSNKVCNWQQSSSVLWHRRLIDSRIILVKKHWAILSPADVCWEIRCSSPVCFLASDREFAAGSPCAAPSTWARPAATEGRTPGRSNFPPHRTPSSPPRSPNLTEGKKQKYIQHIKCVCAKTRKLQYVNIILLYSLYHFLLTINRQKQTRAQTPAD